MSNTTWYQGKIKHTKQLESGAFKRVTDTHLFSAMSYTDAESRAYEELGSTIRGEFSVVGLIPFPVCDLFDYENKNDWYSVMVSTQSPDLDSQKVKMIKAKYKNADYECGLNCKSMYPNIPDSVRICKKTER
jgi:hypothetical protein